MARMHLSDGSVRLMRMTEDLTGPVDLGDPREFIIIELAEAIKALIGLISERIHKPPPTDDPKQRQPDIRLDKDATGWGPAISLEKALKQAIVYFERL